MEKGPIKQKRPVLIKGQVKLPAVPPFLIQKIRSNENANTFSAFNAGLRSGYLETFHHSLSDPFADPLSAGLPATPALCRCAKRFDLRLKGLT